MSSSDDRLIVSLDLLVPGADTVVEKLGSLVGYYKVQTGLLMDANGIRFIEGLLKKGKSVMLDIKAHSTPEHMIDMVRGAARLGVTSMTLHIQNGRALRTVSLARNSAGASKLKLIGVSLLSNTNKWDLVESGIDTDPEQLILNRLALAINSGLDGIVCPPQYVQPASVVVPMEARKAGFMLATPGMRIGSEPRGSRSHIMLVEPTQALRLGATHVIVGRSITDQVTSSTFVKNVEDLVQAMAKIPKPTFDDIARPGQQPAS